MESASNQGSKCQLSHFITFELPTAAASILCTRTRRRGPRTYGGDTSPQTLAWIRCCRYPCPLPTCSLPWCAAHYRSTHVATSTPAQRARRAYEWRHHQTAHPGVRLNTTPASTPITPSRAAQPRMPEVPSSSQNCGPSTQQPVAFAAPRGGIKLHLGCAPKPHPIHI